MDWDILTRIPLKAQLYERETYFRDGLTDAIEALGNGTAQTLQHSAILMVKPDGLVSGKASTIVEFLRNNGFAIVAVETPTLSRFHWRELWRYQLTSATQDRLAVNDLVLRHVSLLLVLRHEGDCDIPATVRLSGLKGPSDVASQSPDCLRRLIAQPNRIFSFFHVADEPADLLRELAVILDVPERRRVLAALAGDILSPVDRQRLDDALRASARSSRPLDGESAVRRALQTLERSENDQGPHAALALQRVRCDLDRMGRGERIAWRPFMRALDAAGIQLDPWDLATLGASFIVYDEPGMSKQILAVDATLWGPTPR
jgi:nucleoside diphosphate kinase